MTDSRIIVAIDSYNYKNSVALLDALNPELCMVKIGSVAFNSLGRDFVELTYDRGFKIFLDLKLHDIPNTVRESIKGLISLPIQMLTIHASGGLQMMKAAMEAVQGTNIKVFGVTALTSLSDKDTNDIYKRDVVELVNSMLDLIEAAGLDGVVCSPHELVSVTRRDSLLSITPGIRLIKTNDDQDRIMTAKQAIDLGADYLVIGRPITTSGDVKKSLNEIYQSIQ